MFNNVMKGGKKQEDINFAPLDRESEGGLGGTSSEVFGPLVRHLSLPATFRLRATSPT